MAGDWIKVEHATIDKPEVALFSELLGVPVAQGFGLLVMFWMWCDRNSRNGVVTHASRMSVDTITHTPGFSAALEAIGWGEFDDSTRTMTLPNFTRHNENTAKTRALGQKRASTFREQDRYETVTRVEKRTEEKSKGVKASTAPKGASNRKTPPPEGFSVSTSVQDWAAKNGHTRLPERLEHFLGKCRANNYRYADWDAAFMGAVRDDWAKFGAANADPRLTVVGQVTAKNLERWIASEGEKDGTTGP